MATNAVVLNVYNHHVSHSLQVSLLLGGDGAAVEGSAPMPISYSDIAGVGVAKFLDYISPEEAASLVSTIFNIFWCFLIDAVTFFKILSVALSFC